jgi:aspartate/glutamate racemase
MRLKQIGLICGLSWKSTNLYYQTINETISNALGNQYSAPRNI